MKRISKELIRLSTDYFSLKNPNYGFKIIVDYQIDTEFTTNVTKILDKYSNINNYYLRFTSGILELKSLSS